MSGWRLQKQPGLAGQLTRYLVRVDHGQHRDTEIGWVASRHLPWSPEPRWYAYLSGPDRFVTMTFGAFTGQIATYRNSHDAAVALVRTAGCAAVLGKEHDRVPAN